MLTMIWLLLMSIVLFRSVPVIELIVWYEINYGQTKIPEFICLFIWIGYIMWSLLWRLILETKIPIQVRENM